GGRAEAADDVRPYRRELALEPLMARVDLALRRGLVQAPLAAQLPLEVLHGVGDVKVLALDASGLERAVEQPAGRPDEGQALLVFLVAGLLADQHDPGVRVARAKYRLGGIGPQRAIPARSGFFPNLLQAHRQLESPA